MQGTSKMDKMIVASYSHIPVIDVGPLVRGEPERHQVAAKIGEACRDCGFFYIVGHGVDEGLQQQLDQFSQRFFAQDLETKQQISMSRGGKATSMSALNSPPASPI
jgi:isopenicillin N synthase-like dioxygenase